MTTRPAKRKRPLGQEVRAVEVSAGHKRRRAAAIGVAAGRQFRRQAFPPVLTHEVEPGRAAAIAAEHPFPFDHTDTRGRLSSTDVQ